MRRLILLLLVQTLTVLTGGNFILSSQQQSATLVLPDATYRKPMEDFAWHIGQVTGKTPAIAQPGQTVTGPRLVFNLLKVKDLQKIDEFSFDFPEDQVMRVTCTDTSLQWALNRIMEDHAGIRFLMPEYCGTHIPRKASVSIPRSPRAFKPSFFARGHYYSTDQWEAHVNTIEKLHFNHEIHTAIFPSGHYGRVGYPPEIMPVHKGRRLKTIPNPRRPAQFWQPCYSNPRTAELAAQNILEYLEKHPETTSVSLTINDNGGFCECDQCRKANGGDKITKTGTVVVNNQSEVYFTWVNRVASIVARKHPKLLMPALAYAQVLDAPSFKMHPNVPIIITLDLYATTDPQVRKKNLKLIADWSQRASLIGCWDYAWGYHYVLPRMYIQRQIAMMRYLHQHNARIYFLEYEATDGHEGPKPYLYAKLLWDINADADAIQREWYDLAVGTEAAPYLRGYFDFWEAYFAGPEVRKTPWFASAKYVYMTWGATNHMYGLKKGDLAKARSLMEKVVQLAETREQKERARIFMRRFEMTETVATLYGAEPMPPNGIVTSWQDALAICQNIAACAPTIAKLEQLKKDLAQEPIIGKHMYKHNMGRIMKFSPDFVLAEQLSLVTAFTTHPRVAQALRKIVSIVSTKALPEGIRKVAAYLADGLDLPNECTAGDFEDDTKGLSLLKVTGDGAGTQKIVPLKETGQGHALQVSPGNLTNLYTVLKARPNSLYLVTFRLLLPTGTSENFIRNTLFACKGESAIEWWEVSKNFVPAGKWVTIAMMGNTRKECNGFQFSLDLGNFEPNQVVLVDNLTQIRIGDSVKVKPLDLAKGPAPLPEQDGFRNLSLRLNPNRGLAKDIDITMRTYKDGVKTAILKGSKDANLSHFFSSGAALRASRTHRLLLKVKVKGQGQFVCGTYAYAPTGTAFRGTHATSVRLDGDDVEIVTHEVDLSKAWGTDQNLQLRPVIGFIGGGGQAEVVSIQYKIVK